MNNLQQRLTDVFNVLDSRFLERTYQIKCIAICMLAGENAWLFGPPGTGKSMVCRAFSLILDAKFYERQCSRTTTPDEIFGPVSIQAMKKDVLQRATAGYLSEAEIAFLDEAGKLSSAIQNTTLSVLNERVFHNGNRIEQVPLRALFAASNEMPDPETAGAFFNRFVVRINVGDLEEDSSWIKILTMPNLLKDCPRC